VGLPKAGQSCAIAGGNSVQTMLQELYILGVASAGASGSIAACIQATAAKVTAGSFDDRPWYQNNVDPITEWYLMVNAQALLVLTEAWHYRAWQASDSPQISDSAELWNAICPSGSEPAGCVDPITYYNETFYPNLKDQVRAGACRTAPTST